MGVVGEMHGYRLFSVQIVGYQSCLASLVFYQRVKKLLLSRQPAFASETTSF